MIHRISFHIASGLGLLLLTVIVPDLSLAQKAGEKSRGYTCENFSFAFTLPNIPPSHRVPERVFLNGRVKSIKNEAYTAVQKENNKIEKGEKIPRMFAEKWIYHPNGNLKEVVKNKFNRTLIESYREDGSILRKTIHYTSPHKDIDKEVKKYNSKGDVVQSNLYKDSTLIIKDISSYQYGEHGFEVNKRKRKKLQETGGFRSYGSGKTILEYDSSAHVIKEVEKSIKEDGSYQTVYKIVREFTENGELKTESRFIRENERPLKLTDHEIYNYNEEGRVKEIKHFREGKKAHHLNSRVTFEYVDSVKIMRELNYQHENNAEGGEKPKEGSVKVSKYIDQYHLLDYKAYDEEGELTDQYEFEYENGRIKRVISSEHESTYKYGEHDAKGNLTKYIKYRDGAPYRIFIRKIDYY